MIEYDMPRRVSRAVNDIESQITDGHSITILQPTIRLKGLRFHPPALAIIVQLGDPEAVFLMRTFDFQAEFLRQHPCLAAMIKMAVGDEQLFQLNPCFCHCILQLVQVAAGINQRTLVGFCAPEQSAILFKWRDRDDHRLQGRLGVHAGCDV